jgi:hypothetical protein
MLTPSRLESLTLQPHSYIQADVKNYNRHRGQIHCPCVAVRPIWILAAVLSLIQGCFRRMTVELADSESPLRMFQILRAFSRIRSGYPSNEFWAVDITWAAGLARLSRFRARRRAGFRDAQTRFGSDSHLMSQGSRRGRVS